MSYVPAFDCNQMMMYSWYMFVDPRSIPKLINAFVDSLDLTKYGVKEAAKEGSLPMTREVCISCTFIATVKGTIPPLNCLKAVKSTSKWMLGGVEPNFRTITDFRKNNIDSLKEIFYKFNCRISGVVECGFILIAGCKFYANNSKDNNFTKHNLDDQIKWLNTRTNKYLRIVKDIDEQENLEETPEKIESVNYFV